MAIQRLDIEVKTNGVDAPGSTGTSRKLTALEFNEVVAKLNELVENANKKAYLTQAEYDALKQGGQLDDETEYNILEAE